MSDLRWEFNVCFYISPTSNQPDWPYLQLPLRSAMESANSNGEVMHISVEPKITTLKPWTAIGISPLTVVSGIE